MLRAANSLNMSKNPATATIAPMFRMFCTAAVANIGGE